MHQDNYYWNLINPNALQFGLQLILPVKNGSLDYLLESHKKLYKHIASFAPGSSQKVI